MIGQEAKARKLTAVSSAPSQARAKLSREDPTDGPTQLMATWDAFGSVYLPYRMLLLAKLIDRRAAEQVAHLNLSLAEWRVIAHIGRFGKLSISQISRSAFVDRAEVCRAAAALEKGGVLRRETNPANRRSQLLDLTAKGLTLFESTSTSRLAFFRDVCGELTAAERKAMESGLRKMALRISNGSRP